MHNIIWSLSLIDNEWTIKVCDKRVAHWSPLSSVVQDICYLRQLVQDYFDTLPEGWEHLISCYYNSQDASGMFMVDSAGAWQSAREAA